MGEHGAVPDLCHATTRNHSVFVRTLHEACLAMGGEHHLAAYLGVELELLNRWLEGKERPPDEVFLRCVDLLQGPQERAIRSGPPKKPS